MSPSVPADVRLQVVDPGVHVEHWLVVHVWKTPQDMLSPSESQESLDFELFTQNEEDVFPEQLTQFAPLL